AARRTGFFRRITPTPQTIASAAPPLHQRRRGGFSLSEAVFERNSNCCNKPPPVISLFCRSTEVLCEHETNVIGPPLKPFGICLLRQRQPLDRAGRRRRPALWR